VGEEEIERKRKRRRQCTENVSVVRESSKNTRGAANQNLKTEFINFFNFFFTWGVCPMSPHVNPPLKEGGEEI
jgi:hypothetical protein